MNYLCVLLLLAACQLGLARAMERQLSVVGDGASLTFSRGTAKETRVTADTFNRIFDLFEEIQTELQATKEELRATKEELGATKQELQTTKDELLLKATKQELQSTVDLFRFTGRSAMVVNLDSRTSRAGDAKWVDSFGMECSVTGAVYNETEQAWQFKRTGTNTFIRCPFEMGPARYPELTMAIEFKLDSDYDKDATWGWIIGHDNGGYDRSLVLSDERFGKNADNTNANRGVGLAAGKSWASGIGRSVGSRVA